MDGKKDDALKCIGFAKEAISSGHKHRALKFIRIAQCLDRTLSVDDLIAACEKIDSSKPGPSKNGDNVDKHQTGVRVGEGNYTEEHVKLIKQIKTHNDYYALLGVEKTCSVKEIRKAYKKLSLKVHPDKNKAPGAEEAFKKVFKAFKCLSEECSRRHYDQTRFMDGFERNVRRRRPRNDVSNDEFDPYEIRRPFFRPSDVFHKPAAERSRQRGTRQRNDDEIKISRIEYLMFCILFFVLLLLAISPSCSVFDKPKTRYSLKRSFWYQYPRVTRFYGLEYFVKSDFDQKYPIGSSSRSNIEDHVVQDHMKLLGRLCQFELGRPQQSTLPTPHCDKLRSLRGDPVFSVWGLRL